jgi:hypothetical protein
MSLRHAQFGPQFTWTKSDVKALLHAMVKSQDKIENKNHTSLDIAGNILPKIN